LVRGLRTNWLIVGIIAPNLPPWEAAIYMPVRC
jgi:hypothetical protein